jgi:hypothetical protein
MLVALGLAGVPATLRVLAAIVLRLGATYVHRIAWPSERTNKGLMSILSTTGLQLLSVVFGVLQFDVLV